MIPFFESLSRALRRPRRNGNVRSRREYRQRPLTHHPSGTPGWLFGRGVVDFVPYLREIKALNIDGAVSIELEYSPQPEKIVDWVREAYEQTDQLMRQVGLRG